NVKRVEVIAVGRTRIITPAGETWDEWFDGHIYDKEQTRQRQGAF
ncbi:AbrB/MazE/SpoVT family DNA-binding domain-containing protein, partial [Shigella sonnei]